MGASTITFSSHLSKTAKKDVDGSPAIASNNDNNNNNNSPLPLKYKTRERLEKDNSSFDHTKHPALFQICRDCYWCATVIASFTSLSEPKARNQERCPLCYNDSLDLLTICPKESFRFELDTKRGISLAFGVSS